MSSADKILLAKVERARAQMIFASEEECQTALAVLEDHLPADIRLGRALSAIRAATKGEWKSSVADKHLCELMKEISGSKGYKDVAEKGDEAGDVERALSFLSADSERSVRLLGISPGAWAGWLDGKNPSEHNKRKILWIADLCKKHSSEWLEENTEVISGWRGGPQPQLPDASQATT